jgi:hypothetical protein
VRAPPRVVYVLSQFPCYDEAFLLREIHAVAQKIDTWVFSLRPSRDPVVHEEARALGPGTLSVAVRRSTRIARAHRRLLRPRPRRSHAAVARLSPNWRAPSSCSRPRLPPEGLLARGVAMRTGDRPARGLGHLPCHGRPLRLRRRACPSASRPRPRHLRRHHEPGGQAAAGDFVTTCTSKNAGHLGRSPRAPRGPDRGGAPRVPCPRSAIHRGDRALSVLSVGALHRHKGFDLSTRSPCSRRRPRPPLHDRGGGPLEDELRGRVMRPASPTGSPDRGARQRRSSPVRARLGLRADGAAGGTGAFQT